MWFGQKLYDFDGKTQFGKWKPYASRWEAFEDDCDLISVLEICCTVADYEAWVKANKPKARLNMPFSGPFYADFDAPEDLPGLKLHLVTLLRDLIDEFGLQEQDIQLWFSGAKGFHLLLPEALFSPTGYSHRDLPRIYRDFGFALGLDEIMDHVVYSGGRGRLWRVEGKLRENGCRKMPLTFAQLTNLTIPEIKRLSRASRPPSPIRGPKVRPNKGLCELFDEVVSLYEGNLRTRKQAAAAQMVDPNKAGSSGTNGQTEIEKLLDDLPPNAVEDYGDWLRVGMALHNESEGATWGLALWDTWSRRSTKYNEEYLQATWDRFEMSEDGITLGTLFYMARRGRRAPRRANARPLVKGGN